MTIRSIRQDGRGYNAARAKRHGERFASQAALDAAMSDAVTVADGKVLTFGDTRLTAHLFGPSEAERTLVLTRDDGTSFVGDLVNVGVPAVPFESLDEWLTQLDQLERLTAGGSTYQGHGVVPAAAGALSDQRHFLVTLRNAVTAATRDGELSARDREEVVFELEALWPFYMGVAGNTRRQILAFDANLVAEQLGAKVAE